MPLLVKDLLKPDIYTIDSEDPIKIAANMMNSFGISSLVVTSEGMAVGIITERDIMKSLMFSIPNLPELQVKNIMSTNLITIRDEATVKESLELMNGKRIKKLPVKNAEGVIVGIISMTDIVNRQPEIISRSEKLIEENEGLDRYTLTVAHDLKAPLRHIAAFGKILKEDYGVKLDETGCLYIDRIVKATKQMTRIVDDLLSLSKLDKMEADTGLQSLNIILEEIGTECKSRKYSEVRIECEDYMTSNVGLIRQLFTNLVSNGLKFNKSNPPRVRISSTQLETGVMFKVQDNGIGIEEDNHGKIFELFTRLNTQEEYPGTGAGLTICKKIVEKLGGTIRLESKVGEGTIFFIELPSSIVKADSQQPSQAGPQVVSIN